MHSKLGTTAEVQLSRQGSLEPELPQKVLESLFNMPTPKSAEHEPNSMNWRNIVKKMTSLGQRLETCAGDGAAVKSSPGIFAFLSCTGCWIKGLVLCLSVFID